MKRILQAIFKSQAVKALDPNAKLRNRGLVVFPATSPLVMDHKDHFPINDEAQARDALSRVSAFDSVPPWYRGHSVEELKAHVRSMVAHHYPGMSVDMHPESKAVTYGPKRRIKACAVTHVSLCRRGVNQMPILMKSGGRVQFDMLFKQAEEGLLHALVYVPEENGAVDSQGDVAPREVVKSMAHGFLANGGQLDIEHDLNVLSPEQASVAETFLVQKGDPRFADWKDYHGNTVDPTDSWGMVIKVNDPELRKAIKDQRINGVSLFGMAEVQPIGKSSTSAATDDYLENMDQTQLNEILDARDAKLLEAVTKAVAPKAVVAPPAKTEIKFEGDPLNLEDLAKHEEKLFMASLDLSKAEDVKKLRTYVEAKKAPAPAAKPAEQTAAQKAAAASTQSPAEKAEEGQPKTEAELLKSGSEFSKKMTKILGRA